MYPTFGTVINFFMEYHMNKIHDSSTSKEWSAFLPWTEWRFVRCSLYGKDGNHYHTQWEQPIRSSLKEDHAVTRLVKNSCPTVNFLIEDFNGRTSMVLTRIEEREWRLGTGCFKWLSPFRNPTINRSLNIQFTTPIGDRDSFDDGIADTSFIMRDAENHDHAFNRFIDEYNIKYPTHQVKLLQSHVDIF